MIYVHQTVDVKEMLTTDVVVEATDMTTEVAECHLAFGSSYF